MCDGEEERKKEGNRLSTSLSSYRPAPPPVFNSCTTLNQSPSFILRSTARSLVVQSRERQVNWYTAGLIPRLSVTIDCSMGMRPAGDVRVRSL